MGEGGMRDLGESSVLKLSQHKTLFSSIQEIFDHVCVGVIYTCGKSNVQALTMTKMTKTEQEAVGWDW